MNVLVFDQVQLGYYTIGEKVGQAWSARKDEEIMVKPIVKDIFFLGQKSEMLHFVIVMYRSGISSFCVFGD